MTAKPAIGTSCSPTPASHLTNKIGTEDVGGTVLRTMNTALITWYLSDRAKSGCRCWRIHARSLRHGLSHVVCVLTWPGQDYRLLEFGHPHNQAWQGFHEGNTGEDGRHGDGTWPSLLTNSTRRWGSPTGQTHQKLNRSGRLPRFGTPRGPGLALRAIEAASDWPSHPVSQPPP